MKILKTLAILMVATFAFNAASAQVHHKKHHKKHHRHHHHAPVVRH